MYMRLGFSVAIHVDPDVLLVDEVLAVGDEGFTHKCLDKFAEFKRRNKTILLVTHSLGLVERFCDEAVWLDAGQKRGEGDPKRVVGAYMTDVERQEEQFLADDRRARRRPKPASAPAAPAPVPSTPARSRPTCRARPRADGARAASRSPTSTLAERPGPGDAHLSHRRAADASALQVHAERTVDGLRLRRRHLQRRRACASTARTPTSRSTSRTALDGDAEVRFDIDALDLVEGTYKLDVAVHKRDGAPYDYHRLLYTFRVKSRLKDVGIYRPRHHWGFAGGVTLRPQA